jgi:hypothetical protein
MRSGGGFGRLGLGALAALLALVGAGPARASTLDVNSYVLGELVQVRSAVRNGPVYASEFQVELGGLSGFSYCVDLAQSLGVGETTGWDVLSPEANAGVIRAAWLVDRFHGTLGSSVSRRTEVTALQIAIWEALLDAETGFDLATGGFAIVEGGASADALSLASSFLGELAGADLSVFVTNAQWAVNARRQDQLVFTNPIPEPSSVLLFGVGAGVVALAVRRKRA